MWAGRLADAQAPEAFGESFTVRRGLFVHQHDRMAAECVLHVRVRLACARLPVHPWLSQQSRENEAVDVAAAIVARIDDQALTVEYRIEIAEPRCDIARRHGAKMNIADPVLRQLVRSLTARKFPVAVTQRSFAILFCCRNTVVWDWEKK